MNNKSNITNTTTRRVFPGLVGSTSTMAPPPPEMGIGKGEEDHSLPEAPNSECSYNDTPVTMQEISDLLDAALKITPHPR